MNLTVRRKSAICAAVILLCSAFLAAQEAKKSAPTKKSAAAATSNKFGAPSTILSISMLKFREGLSETQKQQAIDAIKDGIRKMAAEIPGIKNVWLKPSRMQPRDYDYAFVIEFVNREAAENYVDHPAHEAWSKQLQTIREASISPQITN